MTTTWHYDVGLVLDNNGQPLGGALGQYRLATTNGPGTVVQAVDTSGNPMTAIQTSQAGVFSRFNITAGDLDSTGYLDFGSVIMPVASIEALNSLPQARAAQAAAEAAVTAAQQAVQNAQAAVAAAQAGAGGSGGGSGGLLDANGFVKQDFLTPGTIISVSYTAAQAAANRAVFTSRSDLRLAIVDTSGTVARGAFTNFSWMLPDWDYFEPTAS